MQPGCFVQAETMIKQLGFIIPALFLLASCEATLSGFEKGDFSGWFTEFPKWYSGQIVTSPVRCGRYAARFESRKGDKHWMGKYRSEVHEYFSKAPYNQSIWYGFSTFIPEDWPDLDSRTVISQWHATPDRGEIYRSPPLAIRYTGGQMTVTGIYSAERIQRRNDGDRLILYTHQGAWEKGIWNDWVFQVIWNWQRDGMVKAWLNGEQIVDYHGPIGYNDAAGAWFKMGIYRDDHDVPQVLYHDEYKRGKSFAEVDPRQCD